jgi:hypothetical protein
LKELSSVWDVVVVDDGDGKNNDDVFDDLDEVWRG